MSKTINEQKDWYEFQREFCNRAKPFVHTLGCHHIFPNDELIRIGNDAAFPHHWELGKNGDSRKRHPWKTRIVFEAGGYITGEEERGEQQSFDLEANPNAGFYREFDPSEGHEIDEEVEKTIKLHEETWSSYDARVSFDLTNTTTLKADAKAGIGGVAEANTSVESVTTSKLGTDFGMDDGKRTVNEINHRVLERVKAPAGSRPFALSVDVSKKKVITPITEVGYRDCSFFFDLFDWADEQQPFLRDSIDRGPNIIRCDNIQDLIWFIEGQRPAEYPGMKYYLQRMRAGRTKVERGKKWASYIDGSCAGALDFYEWLKDKETRKAEITKQKVSIYDHAGKVRTVWLGLDKNWPGWDKEGKVSERASQDGTS